MKRYPHDHEQQEMQISPVQHTINCEQTETESRRLHDCCHRECIDACRKHKECGKGNGICVLVNEPENNSDIKK